MSQITENTIVVKAKDVEKLNIAFKMQNENRLWVDNPVEIFKNDEIAIYVFDCNGQPLDVEESVDWLILETNFLDGDSYYTQYFNEELGFYEETETPAEELIRVLLGEEIYERIKDDLCYSVVSSFYSLNKEMSLDSLDSRIMNAQDTNVPKNNFEKSKSNIQDKLK